MSNNVLSLFEESIEVKRKIVKEKIYDVLPLMGDSIACSIKKGNKLLFCGNGGSAADSQHLVAELLVRLRPTVNRDSLPAVTLFQDVSTITACGNDFGFDSLFERTLSSLGQAGDILIAITTSGNSENVLRAMKMAKKKNIQVFGFLGGEGGKALNLCDLAFLVPSQNTHRIQEAHITAGHALLEYIEDRLVDDGYINLDS